MFVVLEGLDGSGTTTQTDAVSKALTERGLSVKTDHEPVYNSPTGNLIQRILTKEIREPDAFSLALLYASDRYQHMSYAKKWFSKYDVVLFDRYTLSSYAYQTAHISEQYPNIHPHMIFSWLIQLQKYVPKPDKTFFLNVDPKVCMARIAKRKNQKEFFDSRLLAVHENYQFLLTNKASVYKYLPEGEHTEIINGDRNVELITEEIVNRIVSGKSND